MHILLEVASAMSISVPVYDEILLIVRERRLMASERKSGKQPSEGIYAEAPGKVSTSAAAPTVSLNADDPNCYAPHCQTLGIQLSAQSIERYIGQSTEIQRLTEKMEKMLRPSAAVQAVMEATQRIRLPSLQMQSFLEATDRLLQPSRELSAALLATEKMLKPSRELQELASRSEKLAYSFSQQSAASLHSLNKVMFQAESVKAVTAMRDALSFSASLKSVLGSFENLQQLPIFERLSSIDHARLQALIDTYGEEEVSYDLTENPPDLKGIEAEVVQALGVSGSQQRLTAPAVALILLLIGNLYLLYEGISKWNDFRESVCDIELRLRAFDSLAQALKFVRRELCDVPPALANSIRLTKADKVNLREGPAMKREVIITLPKFAPLEVVDSDNRDWLLVIYKHEGIEIEGWVSRKFVRPISK